MPRGGEEMDLESILLQEVESAYSSELIFVPPTGIVANLDYSKSLSSYHTIALVAPLESVCKNEDQVEVAREQALDDLPDALRSSPGFLEIALRNLNGAAPPSIMRPIEEGSIERIDIIDYYPYHRPSLEHGPLEAVVLSKIYIQGQVVYNFSAWVYDALGKQWLTYYTGLGQRSGEGHEEHYKIQAQDMSERYKNEQANEKFVNRFKEGYHIIGEEEITQRLS